MTDFQFLLKQQQGLTMALRKLQSRSVSYRRHNTPDWDRLADKIDDAASDLTDALSRIAEAREIEKLNRSRK